MKPQSPKKLTASQQNRRAFTLIELMIAIVIILILLGLLIPAIGGVRLTAQKAAVRTEITNMEAAITAFNADFGMDPPSSIVLWETQAGWNSDLRSKNLIRKMWPQFSFSKQRDFNGDSIYSDSSNKALNAGECLVFFLGGVWDSSGKVPNGFSKNPSDPFIVSSAGGGRMGPYFEFDASRFVDSDKNQVMEYKDTFPGQQKPYLYFSSYGGRGYRITDEVTGTEMQDVYRQGADPTTPPPTNDVPFKAKSYQIISPGVDSQYGTGGIYNPDKNFPANRTAEADNVTNFVGGSLK